MKKAQRALGAWADGVAGKHESELSVVASALDRDLDGAMDALYGDDPWISDHDKSELEDLSGGAVAVVDWD